MTATHKLSGIHKAALTTFAIFGAVGCVGLVNTIRWYLALPADMAAAPLPASFLVAVGKLAIQFLGSTIAEAALLFSGPRTSRGAAIAAIAALLLVHLSGWPAAHRTAAASGTLLLVHGVRLAIASWLVFVLARLAPNNSFKPKPLRGSA